MTNHELGGVLERWAMTQESPRLKDLSSYSSDLSSFAVHAVAQLVREEMSSGTLLVPLPGADAWFGNDVGKAVDSKSLWTVLTHHDKTRVAQVSCLAEQPAKIIGIVGILYDGMVEEFEANLPSFEDRISIAALWDRRTSLEASEVAVRVVLARALLAETVQL